MCQSSHIIIFLELAIGSFRISQRKNIMKFLQIHRSSDIRLYKPGPDGSYFHYSVLPPPVHGFRIKEIHQPFCLCSGIQNISLLTRLIQQMIFRAIIQYGTDMKPHHLYILRITTVKHGFRIFERIAPFKTATTISVSRIKQSPGRIQPKQIKRYSFLTQTFT